MTFEVRKEDNICFTIETHSFRLATQDIVHLAAILAVVALLLLGLYAVAREAGRLMQLSRGAPSGAEPALSERPLASKLGDRARGPLGGRANMMIP